ncbi:hypothetical protein ABW19_dt0206366 [Dactylella cylindrospora]|nr:hypothetical protein ABW19_dt0206366 [Dactylella cylindrospora]
MEIREYDPNAPRRSYTRSSAIKTHRSFIQEKRESSGASHDGILQSLGDEKGVRINGNQLKRFLRQEKISRKNLTKRRKKFIYDGIKRREMKGKKRHGVIFGKTLSEQAVREILDTSPTKFEGDEASPAGITFYTPANDSASPLGDKIIEASECEHIATQEFGHEEGGETQEKSIDSPEIITANPRQTREKSETLKGDQLSEIGLEDIQEPDLGGNNSDAIEVAEGSGSITATSHTALFNESEEGTCDGISLAKLTQEIANMGHWNSDVEMHLIASFGEEFQEDDLPDSHGVESEERLCDVFVSSLESLGMSRFRLMLRPDENADKYFAGWGGNDSSIEQARLSVESIDQVSVDTGESIAAAARFLDLRCPKNANHNDLPCYSTPESPLMPPPRGEPRPERSISSPPEHYEEDVLVHMRTHKFDGRVEQKLWEIVGEVFQPLKDDILTLPDGNWYKSNIGSILYRLQKTILGYGRSHFFTTYAAYLISLLMTSMKKLSVKDEISLYHSVLKGLTTRGMEDNALAALLQRRICDRLYEQGEYDDAAEIQEDAYKVAAKKFGENNVMTVLAQASTVKSMINSNFPTRRKEGRARLQKTIKCIETSIPKTHHNMLWIASSLNHMGRGALDAGENELAAVILKRATLAYRDATHPRDLGYLDTYFRLGAAYHKTGQYKNSLEALITCFNIRKDAHGLEDVRTSGCLVVMIEVMRDRGPVLYDHLIQTLDKALEMFQERGIDRSQNYLKIWELWMAQRSGGLLCSNTFHERGDNY